MELTSDNYRSKESEQHFMSYSQFKGFETCEARQLAIVRGHWQLSDTDAFRTGRMFEDLICGREIKDQEVISTRGATKGEIKAVFQKVAKSAEAFLSQNIFGDLSDFRQQVVVTGEIGGVPYKGTIDFLGDKYGFDTKLVKDFEKVYSASEGARLNWYFAYGYHYQAAIYRELTEGIPQRLAAATKQTPPDIAAIKFSDEILDNALGIVREMSPRYDAIKKGLIDPEPCGRCDYCRQGKELTEWEVVDEYC